MLILFNRVFIVRTTLYYQFLRIRDMSEYRPTDDSSAGRA